MNKKKRILICGASGFIGRNLVNYFHNKGKYEIHAVSYTRSSYNLPGVVWHQEDLRDPKAVDHLFKGVDIVLQAAATTSGANDITNRPYLHVTDNAVMNSYMLKSAFENKVKQFVFFSCTVMYQNSEIPLKESDYDPSKKLHEKYFGVANTKLYLEKMCEFFSNISETQFTVIRHSNIYGPYDKFDYVRSHFLGATISKVLKAKDSITVWGKGLEKRDFVHVDDLCEFVYAALGKQNRKFALYNCGVGKASSIRDTVLKIIEASGKTIKISFDTSKPSIDTSLSLDCDLAQKELGWTPQVPFEEGIRRTLEWWRENIDPETLCMKTQKETILN